jgi:hypothetical protein
MNSFQSSPESQKDDKDMVMYWLGGGILLVLVLAFSYSNSNRSNECSCCSNDHSLEQSNFKSLSETLFTAPIPVSMPFVVQQSELVVPSIGGVVLQGGTNNYVRVAGTATTDATRNTVGTSNNQIQIYNAGNLTAAFDVDGLYVKALNAGTGNITTTGSIGISGTPVGAVYCGAITSGAINTGSGNITTTGSVTSNSVVVGSGGIQIAHGSNNFIYTTTYDGYTPGSLNNNLIIKSWYGIGFATHDNSVRVSIDTRTGNANFSGSLTSSVALTGGEVYTDNWFRVKNQSFGLWWETPEAGITSAVGGGNVHGNICTVGTGRNSWSGYGIGTRHCFMGNGNEVGIYDNNGDWYIHFNTSRDCRIPANLTVGGAVNGVTLSSKKWTFNVDPNRNRNIDWSTIGGSLPGPGLYLWYVFYSVNHNMVCQGFFDYETSVNSLLYGSGGNGYVVTMNTSWVNIQASGVFVDIAKFYMYKIA